jgi:putative Mn2+ efflux pump MntP
MWKAVLFILPLGLDTFAVSAALGMAGLPKSRRLRVSLIMAGFETAMPAIGLLVGRALGHLIGDAADYVAVVVLVLAGAYMLLEEGDETEAVESLASGKGLGLIAIGVSVSLDELAIGFSLGLLHVPLWVAVIVIGVQAFLFSQLGLRLGGRLNQALRERAEKAAGLALIGLAVLIAVETAF